jgi:hypothetical protein
VIVNFHRVSLLFSVLFACLDVSVSNFCLQPIYVECVMLMESWMEALPCVHVLATVWTTVLSTRRSSEPGLAVPRRCAVFHGNWLCSQIAKAKKFLTRSRCSTNNDFRGRLALSTVTGDSLKTVLCYIERRDCRTSAVLLFESNGQILRSFLPRFSSIAVLLSHG